jgi:hypothetical protein
LISEVCFFDSKHKCQRRGAWGGFGFAGRTFSEAFNGRLRDECLNVHQFTSIADAQEKIRAWRVGLQSATTLPRSGT